MLISYDTPDRVPFAFISTLNVNKIGTPTRWKEKESIFLPTIFLSIVHFSHPWNFHWYRMEFLWKYIPCGCSPFHAWPKKFTITRIYYRFIYRPVTFHRSLLCRVSKRYSRSIRENSIETNARTLTGLGCARATVKFHKLNISLVEQRIDGSLGYAEACEFVVNP